MIWCAVETGIVLITKLAQKRLPFATQLIFAIQFASMEFATISQSVNVCLDTLEMTVVLLCCAIQWAGMNLACVTDKVRVIMELGIVYVIPSGLMQTAKPQPAFLAVEFMVVAPLRRLTLVSVIPAG